MMPKKLRSLTNGDAFSGGKLGSKLDQKLKPWLSPVTVKILVLRNPLNGICTTVRTICGQKFSSIRPFLLALLATKTPKWVQIGPQPNKRSGSFWLKQKTINIQKLKLDIQKVQTDSPNIGYVRICDDHLTHGGNLDPIWTQKIFFDLILQEPYDLSRTRDLRY